jgi:cytochrome c553
VPHNEKPVTNRDPSNYLSRAGPRKKIQLLAVAQFQYLCAQSLQHSDMRPPKTAFLFLSLLSFLANAPAAEAPSTDTPPPWAYAVNPPGFKAPADDGSQRHVPDSSVTFTLTQVRDGFVSPDWHSNDHPPLPEIVAHGRKPAVMACGYCHRAEGTGGPENASVAGLPSAYIIQQMAEFKSGGRNSSVPGRAPVTNMIAGAKACTTEEVEAAAAYFSSLKPRQIIRVVETNTVPKHEVFGWHMLPIKNSPPEPIGQRILESPEDLERFVSRDTRVHFIAYVPEGSIAKGRELATTGGNGRTVQCIVCHGPELKGLGLIPPIAGRSPTYLFRQLYDFKHGSRAGLYTPLMKPTVEHLTLDDMIALSAYVASLTP